ADHLATNRLKGDPAVRWSDSLCILTVLVLFLLSSQIEEVGPLDCGHRNLFHAQPSDLPFGLGVTSRHIYALSTKHLVCKVIINRLDRRLLSERGLKRIK